MRSRSSSCHGRMLANAAVERPLPAAQRSTGAFRRLPSPRPLAPRTAGQRSEFAGVPFLLGGQQTSELEAIYPGHAATSDTPLGEIHRSAASDPIEDRVELIGDLLIVGVGIKSCASQSRLLRESEAAASLNFVSESRSGDLHFPCIQADPGSIDLRPRERRQDFGLFGQPCRAIVGKEGSALVERVPYSGGNFFTLPEPRHLNSRNYGQVPTPRQLQPECPLLLRTGSGCHPIGSNSTFWIRPSYAPHGGVRYITPGSSEVPIGRYSRPVRSNRQTAKKVATSKLLVKSSMPVARP